MSVQGAFKSYAVISFAVPILIVGLPLFDAGFAILRRVMHGQNPMVADRGHLHHRLIDMGFSQKQSVFILYAISGVLGITAVTLAESGALRALLLLICMLIFVFAGGYFTTQHNAKMHLGEEQEACDCEAAIIKAHHLEEAQKISEHTENELKNKSLSEENLEDLFDDENVRIYKGKKKTEEVPHEKD